MEDIFLSFMAQDYMGMVILLMLLDARIVGRLDGATLSDKYDHKIQKTKMVLFNLLFYLSFLRRHTSKISELVLIVTLKIRSCW